MAVSSDVSWAGVDAADLGVYLSDAFGVAGRPIGVDGAEFATKVGPLRIVASGPTV